jgi:hypothetical protein
MAGVWGVTEDFTRHIGVRPGKARIFLYSVCASCNAKIHGGDKRLLEVLEAAIVAEARGEDMVCFGSDVRPIFELTTDPLMPDRII